MGTAPEQIDWVSFSKNPCAIDLLEKYQEKVYWFSLFENPEIFEIDYLVLRERIQPFKEELMACCFHPKRLMYYLENFEYDLGEQFI